MPAATQAPPKQQQPPQQPPAQPPPAPPPALIASVIAALSAGATAAGITAALGAKLLAEGIGHLALAAVAHLAASWPREVTGGTGPAARLMMRTNLVRRAQFFLNACRRVQAAVVAARSKNEPAKAAIMDAIATEKRYMALHVQANATRIAAASRVDGMAQTYGNILGWEAILDDRTSKECRVANGGTFTATAPPIIGFPGAVHPACRCRPVKARSGAPSVNAKLAAALISRRR